MAGETYQLPPAKLSDYKAQAEHAGLSYLTYAGQLTSALFPGSDTWSAQQWEEAFWETCTQQQEEAYAFWTWAALPTNQQQTYVRTADGEALSVIVFGHDELPGSSRALQQWSMKNEYCLSQCKRELKALNAQERTATRKLMFIEQTLDSAGCSAVDLRRHIDQQPAKSCSLRMDACKKQLEKGQLCCPLTFCIFCFQYHCFASELQEEKRARATARTQKESTGRCRWRCAERSRNAAV